MEQDGQWRSRIANIIGDQVHRYRRECGLSAQQLSDRIAGLGGALPRGVIAKLESGRRNMVSVDELLVLAEALEVSPLLLVIPVGRVQTVEILPGLDTPTWEAALWWRGEGTHIKVVSGEGPVLVSDATRKTPADWVLEHQDLVARWTVTDEKARNDAHMVGRASEAERNGWLLTFERDRDRAAQLEKQLSALRQAMRDKGLIPPPLPPELAHIDPQRPPGAEGAQSQEQPVVAAIVTSPLGVLVGRRNDRTPPWGFISGEIEPGELPEDAAVREVKEETGLEVRAGQVIGERDHPATGRHMVYMAAEPTRGTEVFVGDEAELAEVRWVSPAEADELMGGQMFGPVREYLAHAESHDGHGI